jgi:hypothetical protein
MLVKCRVALSHCNHSHLLVARGIPSKCNRNSFHIKFLSFGTVKRTLITCGPIKLLPNNPHHTLSGNLCWKWHSLPKSVNSLYWYKLFCARKMKPHQWTECGAMVADIHETVQLAWSPGKGCVLFGHDADRNNHSTKFSVLQQPSWKFCIHMNLGFAELLSEHHLLHTVIHVLHLLMGRNQSPSKFCVHSKYFCNVEFYKMDIIASNPHQPHHFHCRNRIQKTFQNILHMSTC